jgi:hypothetical protein
MVYVYDKNNRQYQPCSNAMARKLLRENYAKIVNYKPFSIKLKVDIDEPYEKIVDPATKDSTNG